MVCILLENNKLLKSPKGKNTEISWRYVGSDCDSDEEYNKNKIDFEEINTKNSIYYINFKKKIFLDKNKKCNRISVLIRCTCLYLILIG